ncbi:hypothetical protein FM076_09670 [Streptomyces albus subsp. chlorinus]|uniref:hypothetical protein n=1 Tax=Streptomyces albus TaxID=1888 RepID=UPI00156D4FE2|nr:hypothetical protein [Streptomyces albus]NSC21458.1 hypothetical protein [Streptomyces albus subsp. chlorinus]
MADAFPLRLASHRPGWYGTCRRCGQPLTAEATAAEDDKALTSLGARCRRCVGTDATHSIDKGKDNGRAAG